MGHIHDMCQIPTFLLVPAVLGCRNVGHFLALILEHIYFIDSYHTCSTHIRLSSKIAQQLYFLNLSAALDSNTANCETHYSVVSVLVIMEYVEVLSKKNYEECWFYIARKK